MIAAAICFLALSAPVSANPSGSVILQSPEPFSLSAYDAIQAMAMIRSNGLLEHRTDSGRISIVAVHTLWAVFKGVDPAGFAGHQRRYDLILNGAPLDWDHLFIPYGTGLINLRLLFTYRNQYPPAGLLYRIP